MFNHTITNSAVTQSSLMNPSSASDFFYLVRFYSHSSYFNTPIEQFEVLKVGPSVVLEKFTFYYQELCNTLNLSSLSELSLYLCVVYTLVVGSLFKNPKFIPTAWLALSVEMFIRAIHSFLKANGTLAQQAYLPFFTVVALSLITYNFGGLFPFGYTFSAHIICTFFYSFTVFFGLNLIALIRYKENFFNIFLPSGTSFSMSFLMVALEIISYISRPFSMAIRLFANLMAGHSLLKILLSFSFQGFSSGKVLFFILAGFSLTLISLILSMECIVAGLQIFVFLTLMSLYLTDVHTVKH